MSETYTLNPIPQTLALCLAMLLLSCSDLGRDNPNDTGSLVPSSSSSIVPSSSSVITICTAANNNDTHYCSNGTMKEYIIIEDDRDGKTYKAVEISTQIWMAENLNYSGTESDTVGKCYSNTASNCDTYGRLYDWATAMALPSSCNTSTCSGQVQTKHRGICPNNWHIPDDTEWDALMLFVHKDNDLNSDFIYSSNFNGKYLKATSGWNESGNGTDKYGFAALPGGCQNAGTFSYVGDFGAWWSAIEYNNNEAQSRNVYYDIEGAHLNHYSKTTFLFSVRCIKD